VGRVLCYQEQSNAARGFVSGLFHTSGVTQLIFFWYFSNLEGHSKYIALSGAGLTGQTAYVGVFEEMKLQKDHVVIVSGAAG
jgi:hypothetical protein